MNRFYTQKTYTKDKKLVDIFVREDNGKGNLNHPFIASILLPNGDGVQKEGYAKLLSSSPEMLALLYEVVNNQQSADRYCGEFPEDLFDRIDSLVTELLEELNQ